MRTYKSCASSYDNPDYLIRNKYLLLQKEGRCMFPLAERRNHNLPEHRSLARINKEPKFGISKDSPWENKHTIINPRINSLHESNRLKLNVTTNSFYDSS